MVSLETRVDAKHTVECRDKGPPMERSSISIQRKSLTNYGPLAPWHFARVIAPICPFSYSLIFLATVLGALLFADPSLAQTAKVHASRPATYSELPSDIPEKFE